MKYIIIILMMISMIHLVSGACCPANSNCTVTETCQDGACGDCYITIYNPDGQLNQSGDMSMVTTSTYTYNISPIFSELSTYNYRINCSTGDSCVVGPCAIEVKQMCEDVNMDPIGMIIFIPIAIAFFYLFVSWLLRGQAHWAMSIALLFLAFIEFFRAYHYSVLALIKYYNIPELMDAIGTGTYSFGIMYAVVIVYFLIHMIAIFTIGLFDKKKKKVGDYGEYDGW